MSTVTEVLNELVRHAVYASGLANLDFQVDSCVPTASVQNGDYQSNFAFRLAKAVKRNPREVAQNLVDALPKHPAIQEVSIAGPGFVNFRLSEIWLAEFLEQQLNEPHRGVPQSGVGKTMVIDYSSPNIAKRMHVGHLRSTVIGNAIVRIYESIGWKVIADNHIGDWGTQFGKLIVAWHLWRSDEAYASDAIGELQRLYVLFGQKAKEEPSLEERARAETVKLQSGDPENRSLWQRFVDVSMKEFESIYRRLDVRFDVALGESFYRDDLQPLVERLLESGQAVVNEGAVILPLGDIEPKLEDKPLLIRKSDGGSLYGTTDLATALHRKKTWNPDKVVYVIDVRQKLHVEQVIAGIKKMGLDLDCFHLHFGMLRLADGAVLATRNLSTTTGESGSLNLKDVLDTAVAHARAVVDEKSGQLPEAERATIAEVIGVGAIRYADLSQNPQSDILFDWSKMLSLEGNTAPYLMYATARCHSILRKAKENGISSSKIRLVDPLERELAIALTRYPEIVLDAASSWRPNVVCDYLFGLANSFARFYGACRVLGDGVAPEVSASRLALVRATALTLGAGMKLVGLQSLERM